MASSGWHVAISGKTYGPFDDAAIAGKVENGQAKADTLIFGPGLSSWLPLKRVPQFSHLFSSHQGTPPPLPETRGGSDEIDFEIHGKEMQFVEIELDPGESAVAESGAMMYMTEGITMNAVFGDGRGQEQGIMDKLVGAGKRLLTGESLFMAVFTNQGQGKQHVSFAAPYPGSIIPMDLRQLGGTLICQKDSFLCAARGVSIGIAFQKKIMVALFGGEGFIMQKLEGDGLAFVHAGGALHQVELEPGKTLRVDTGCLVALEPTVTYDIEMVKGIRNLIGGGEGLFLTTLRGPGKVWLQSLPFSRLAGRIRAAGGGGRQVGEGSVLGRGGILGGDIF